MVRVHGSRRVTARNRRFLGRFVPFGEKMAEPMPLKPMSITEEHVDFNQQQPVLPSVKPAPPLSNPPPSPTETPQPAPIDTPQPSQVPIADPLENVPKESQMPPMKKTGGETNIPGPPLGESAPRRSTREKKKQTSMDSGSKENEK